MIYDDHDLQRTRDWIVKFKREHDQLLDTDGDWVYIERNALRSIIAELECQIDEYLADQRWEDEGGSIT